MFRGETALSVPMHTTFSTLCINDASITFWEPTTFVLIASNGLYSIIGTCFNAVRYGNVFGSSGSVIPKFLEQVKNNKKITITDENMTRFSITMEQALDFILDCTINGKAAEIYVPKLKSYSISQIKDAFCKLFGNIDVENIGIRPGEKLHEVLINQEEMRYCWNLNDKFMISNPNVKDEEILNSYNSKIKKSSDFNAYTSENSEKLAVGEIQDLIQEFEKNTDI